MIAEGIIMSNIVYVITVYGVPPQPPSGHSEQCSKLRDKAGLECKGLGAAITVRLAKAVSSTVGVLPDNSSSVQS